MPSETADRPRLRPPRRVVLWLAWLGTALLSLGVLAAPARAAELRPGDDPSDVYSIAREVAADLNSNLVPRAAAAQGGQLKIAVQPFKVDEVNDLELAQRLNAAVETALQRDSGGKVAIVARADFEKVWAEANEFQGTDPTEQFRGLVHDAGADVLVLGTLAPAGGGGYMVDYRAYDVRPSSSAVALAFTREPRRLAVPVAARTLLSIDEALFGASVALARQLVQADDLPDARVAISHVGAGGRLVDILLNRLEDRLREQLPEAIKRAETGAQPYSGAAPGHRAMTEIVISAKLYELEHSIEVRFQAQVMGRGAPAAMTVSVAKDDPVFSGFLPLRQDGRVQATAEAVVGGALDRDAARRAARALARASVIAQWTNPALDDAPVMVNGLTDGVIAMRAIAGGVTTREQWTMEELDGGKRVRATLSAKVNALGGGDAPVLRAVISSPVIESMRPFTVTLSSDRTAYVAVFGWASDDLVVQAYPDPGRPPLVVAANKPLMLPRKDKGDPDLIAQLREGAAADFESLIIVASSRPIDFGQIAAKPAATDNDNQQSGTPIQMVFEALSRISGNISIAIVPYQLMGKQ